MNYGRYDLIKNVADLDFSFIDRFDVFVFYSVEEYTYAIVNLIKNARSDKRIIFLDDKAEEIWGGGVEVYTRKDVFKLELQKCCWITSDNQLFEDSRLPECRANVYCSLNVMSSLMWCAKKESFGEKNADDTILILDFQNKGAGLVDIMLFTCCYKEVAKQRGWKIVIDYSSKNNQYVINEGENMWEYFFESISDLPVQDAYQSKTVIRASTNNMPLAYGYELLYIREFLDVNYMKMIKFNCQTIEQINSLLPNEFREGKRILGLIMRGTDYRKEAATLRKEQVISADIDRVINKCSYMMALWDCDFVFVATEDSEYYSILKEKIGNRMLDISQKRVSHDYSVGYRNTADLLDIEDGRDFGRRYLATICALSKCNLMISNMNNGTFRAACNLNDGKYEWCEIISKK